MVGVFRLWYFFGDLELNLFLQHHVTDRSLRAARNYHQMEVLTAIKFNGILCHLMNLSRFSSEVK